LCVFRAPLSTGTGGGLLFSNLLLPARKNLRRATRPVRQLFQQLLARHGLRCSAAVLGNSMRKAAFGYRHHTVRL
jgi:hypothetical protein